MNTQEARICQFPQKEHIWAVDVGYGYTKALSNRGKKVCFPSVISPARDMPLTELSDDRTGHAVTIHKDGSPDEQFFVGLLAIKEGRSLQFTLDEVKHKHPVHDVVLLTAIALLDPEAPGKLVVGLPVDYYREQGKSLTEHLTNLTAEVSVDGGPKKQISFENVLVYPQGAGAILVAPDMPPSGIVALVDVGHKTTDCVALELGNGGSRPVQSMCISVEAGIVHLHQAVAEEFLKLTGIRLPAVYIEQVLRTGRIWFRGQEIDLSQVIKDNRAGITRSIADGVLAAWGDRADFVYKVYLAGGGVLELPELASIFPGSSIIPDAQYANAMGFLKFGERC